MVAILMGVRWSQHPRCPTTDEWIKKMWYLYIMEFYSALKKNNILSFAGKWIELENIILSKVNQLQKAKGHIFSFVCEVWTQCKSKQYYEKQDTLRGGH
jgi:hypothetical protein